MNKEKHKSKTTTAVEQLEQFPLLQKALKNEEDYSAITYFRRAGDEDSCVSVAAQKEILREQTRIYDREMLL